MVSKALNSSYLHLPQQIGPGWWPRSTPICKGHHLLGCSTQTDTEKEARRRKIRENRSSGEVTGPTSKPSQGHVQSWPPHCLSLGLTTHFHFHATPSAQRRSRYQALDCSLLCQNVGTAEGSAKHVKTSIWTLPLAQLDRDSRVWRHGYPRGRTGGKGNEPIAPLQKLPLTFQRSLHKLWGKYITGSNRKFHLSQCFSFNFPAKSNARVLENPQEKQSIVCLFCTNRTCLVIHLLIFLYIPSKGSFPQQLQHLRAGQPTTPATRTHMLQQATTVGSTLP